VSKKLTVLVAISRTDFGEIVLDELRRIHLPRTRVHRAVSMQRAS